MNAIRRWGRPWRSSTSCLAFLNLSWGLCFFRLYLALFLFHIDTPFISLIFQIGKQKNMHRTANHERYPKMGQWRSSSREKDQGNKRGIDTYLCSESIKVPEI
jgi:hypothetical protein